jgi:type II secretory pathway component PulC
VRFFFTAKALPAAAVLLSFFAGAWSLAASEPAGNSKNGTAGENQPAAESAETVKSTREGVVSIRRAELDEVLDAGPAALLARVRTEPFFRNGRFVGFRIIGFPGGAPEHLDLRRGDVVVRVNGRSIERPEHYFDVFETLRRASKLRFELLRNGRQLELIYPIAP